MTRPQDAIQYDDLDDLPIGVMAKHVRGAAFHQMVRDASIGDVRMLAALHQAGRFKIDSRTVLESPIAMNPILSAGAIQVVDSLASFVLAFEQQYEHESPSEVSRGKSPNTWFCKLKATEELQTLLKKVCHEVLDDLSAFEASDYDFVSASEEDDAAKCIRTSRGVVAAVACALDDAHLLQRCAEPDRASALGTLLSTHSHFTSVGSPDFLCGGFAVLFGSTDCIDVLGSQFPDRLKVVAVNPKLEAADEARNWSPFLLATHVSHKGAPRIAVLDSVLGGLRHADGGYGKDVAAWLPGQALSMVGRGNPQILDVLLRHGVAEIDADATRRVAFEFAIPELAARYLKNAPESDLAAFEDLDGGGRWFSSEHPMKLLISNFDVVNASADATLAMVIEEMASRGLMHHLLEARDDSEVSFAEHLVYDDRPAAMAAMLSNGLDPLTRIGGTDNLTLLEFAQESYVTKSGAFVNMMRAAVARNAANDALEAIAIEASSATQRSAP